MGQGSGAGTWATGDWGGWVKNEEAKSRLIGLGVRCRGMAVGADMEGGGLGSGDIRHFAH